MKSKAAEIVFREKREKRRQLAKLPFEKKIERIPAASSGPSEALFHNFDRVLTACGRRFEKDYGYSRTIRTSTRDLLWTGRKTTRSVPSSS